MFKKQHDVVCNIFLTCACITLLLFIALVKSATWWLLLPLTGGRGGESLELFIWQGEEGRILRFWYNYESNMQSIEPMV